MTKQLFSSNRIIHIAIQFKIKVKNKQTKERANLSAHLFTLIYTAHPSLGINYVFSESNLIHNWRSDTFVHAEQRNWFKQETNVVILQINLVSQGCQMKVDMDSLRTSRAMLLLM